ncbi:uncharacterized protein PITG_22480, partial [Phytophthora infestans T30-4]
IAMVVKVGVADPELTSVALYTPLPWPMRLDLLPFTFLYVTAVYLFALMGDWKPSGILKPFLLPVVIKRGLKCPNWDVSDTRVAVVVGAHAVHEDTFCGYYRATIPPSSASSDLLLPPPPVTGLSKADLCALDIARSRYALDLVKVTPERPPPQNLHENSVYPKIFCFVNTIS